MGPNLPRTARRAVVVLAIAAGVLVPAGFAASRPAHIQVATVVTPTTSPTATPTPNLSATPSPTPPTVRPTAPATTKPATRTTTRAATKTTTRSTTSAPRTSTVKTYRLAPVTAYYSQATIDQGRLVTWMTSPTCLLAGHDNMGWAWLDNVPTGSIVVVTTGPCAGRYKVVGHRWQATKGGAVPSWMAGYDLILQTCTGSSGSGFSLAQRI